MSGSASNSRLRIVPILLAQVVGLACGIGGLWLNSQLLAPATLGFYGVFLSVVPIGAWVVHAGLIKYANRHWAASSARARLSRDLVAAWARRLPWLAALAGVAAWVMPGRHSAETIFLGVMLFIAAALLSLGAIAQAALQARQAHWRDCAVTVGSSVTRSFGPPLLYASLGGSAFLLWLGFGLHAVVLAALGWWMLRADWRGPVMKASAKTDFAAAYEGPLFTTLALASWIVSGMNRWLIASFHGPTEAGYFTLMGGAAVIITAMLGTAILQYAQPGLFALGDQAARNPTPLARRADLLALSYTLLAALALGSFQLAAPLLIGPLINPIYANALGWLLPGGGFGIATMTALIYHNLLLAGRRERACGPVDLTTAAVLIGGSAFSAATSLPGLKLWLLFSPLVPWLLTRTLARHYLFKPAPAPAL
ncbi:hypothetical protein [Oleiharenicola lentus]|uniref:hypothetical protein n=1 Tax=Oleiharenicola lentus TaxID=2508720 RepID=UPI003F665D16